jgi:hypothetical protein
LFMYLLNLSYSLLIWKASSLVCDMTSTEIYKYIMFLLKTMWILWANLHNLYLYMIFFNWLRVNYWWILQFHQFPNIFD